MSISLEVQRIYLNSAGDTIRIDEIFMNPTVSTTAVGAVTRTYRRDLKTSLVLEGGANRTVSSIQIITSANSYDYNASLPANYNWVEWTTISNSRCNMSDLPQIGDDV